MRSSLVIVAVLLLPELALAQGPTPGTPGGPPPPETPVPGSVEEPPAEQPRAVPDDGGEDGVVRTTVTTIPDGAIGIGTGWILPTDVTIPNAASVRFRSASGLTFEALVRLSWEGTTVDNEPDVGPG